MFNNAAAKFRNIMMPIAIKAEPMIEYASNFGTQTGIASWLGHAITKVNPVHGFCFGAVAGAVTNLITLKVYQKLFELKPLGREKLAELTPVERQNHFLKMTYAHNVSYGLSVLVGGACGYAASVGAASAGFVAAPITLSGAALCTGTLLATKTANHYFNLAKTNYLTNLIHKT